MSWVLDWVSTIPALVLAVLFLYGPGLIWGAILGLRRLTLLAVAGPLGVTAIVIAAELGGFTGWSWSWPLLLAVTAAIAAVLALARRLLLHRWRYRVHHDPRAAPPPAPWRSIALAWAVPAVFLGVVLLGVFGSPGNIAQSHDNIFHLNALRYIADTGKASSLTLGYLGTAGGTAFYPAGWHDLVSLVQLASGVSIPAAINATNLVVITCLWPLGCLFLASRVTGERTLSLLVAGVLATAYSTFPYLLLEFGVVYPFLLSMAILPVALGLVIQLLRLGLPAALSTEAAALALAAVLPGMALSHPAAVMALLALSVPMVLAAARRARRLASGPEAARRRRTAGLLAAGYLAAVVVAWVLIRPGRSATRNWDNLGEVLRSLVEVFTHGAIDRPMAVLPTVLTVVGAAVVLNTRRNRWVLGIYLIAAAFFVVGNWKEAPELRWWVTGVFYNDFFRIAGLLPAAGLLTAAIGGTALASTARSFFRAWLVKRDRTPQAWLRPAATALLVAVSLAVVPFFAVTRGVEVAAAKYRFTPTSPLLSSDELALIERLPERVPAGAMTIGDPLTGAALSYAYTGIRTLLPSGETAPMTDAQLLVAKLDEMKTDPAICPIVRERKVQYVLDFGDQSVSWDKPAQVAGLDHLTRSAGFELVDQQGPDARLYRITGCS
ncbi:hypothetical protein LVY72_13135 [Arthrobacter sp. I2-34]|uniref:Uncharacterized protein n=1 Tax=Arthrobacter hankyongi TaxID=2904801 RepID=A0ABS9L836_9MICC|nr:DUF6541 family protein [Arthrobacter hankyongi]MCG2622845.1 hypothetical protein [Arthrobacter hankyongi]